MIRTLLVLCVALVPSFSAAATQAKSYETALFAAGCFWCIQSALDQVDGVIETTVGFAGGTASNPSYHDVSGGNTGHREVIRVVFDPKKISFEKLLDAYWHKIDPTDEGGQFYDRGEQYQTVIYYHNAAQQKVAEASKKKVAAFLKKPIATRIEPAGEFYAAEEYHQKYYQKNPTHYKAYEKGSGRLCKLPEIWQQAGE